MKKHGMSALALAALFVSSTSLAAESSSIRINTIAVGVPIASPVMIEFNIEGNKFQAQNISTKADYGMSYVEIPATFIGKKITSAQFTWKTNQHKLFCSAQGLPVEIKAGLDINSSSLVHFSCSHP